MDLMEPDLFHGLSSTSLLEGGDDNRDSLLDLLSQSFPDMLMQPYGHLSSLPLDAPDLQLCIQDEDYQDLNESLSTIVSLMPNTDDGDPFTPIKKLWPDQLDLLTVPLLDGEDEDLEQIHKSQLLLADQSTLHTPGQLLDSLVIGTNQNILKDLPDVLRKPETKGPAKTVQLLDCVVSSTNQNIYKDLPNVLRKPETKVPAVACVKPVMKVLDSSKPMVSIVKTDRLATPAVASVKPIVKVVKVQDESSDEIDIDIDIETVDDDCRSGAEVLSAKLADMECQAARVRVLPRPQPKAKQPPVLPAPAVSTVKSPTIKVETGCVNKVCPNVPAKIPQVVAPSFSTLLKPISRPKEREPSPALVVEKIKQSVVTPRTSILIPHPVLPQSKGKPSKQEMPATAKVIVDNSQAYDARTFDHDYCNMELVEPPVLVKEEAESFQVTRDDLCVVEESIFTTEMEVPNIRDNNIEVKRETTTDVKCNTFSSMSSASIKPKRELPLSYSKWHRSPSPPFSQSSTPKGRTRRRSSCSPSSVSSQSVYRSRSRSSSHGRKSRSQTRYRRKCSRGRSSRRTHHNSKRNRAYYSRSSSRSSFSSRSRSRSLSRSPSRSMCRSRSRSWDYKRKFNRAPVSSFNREKRNFPEEKSQQIEERRVVYVGRLPDGTTKNDLRHRFGCFGPIQEVSVHFRDTGHNYGFVTFSFKSDAYEAVEHGNDDPNKPKFDLSFGGRRQFCKQRYADLDSQYNNNGYPAISRPAPSDDFDSLLKAAKLKLKTY